MTHRYGRRRWGRKAGPVLAILLALAAWPRASAAAPQTLLDLGDSLSAGYGLDPSEGFQAQLQAALTAAGFDVRVLDGAVSGDTSAGGQARLGWLLGGTVPDAAIVELGGNDGLRGLPTGEMESNLAGIIAELQAKHVGVLLAGMYPPPNLGPDYTRAFRAVFDRLGSTEGVIYVPFFLQGVALHPALLQADGIHPNAAGVRVIVAAILPDVERLLRRSKG